MDSRRAEHLSSAHALGPTLSCWMACHEQQCKRQYCSAVARLRIKYEHEQKLKRHAESASRRGLRSVPPPPSLRQPERHTCTIVSHVRTAQTVAFVVQRTSFAIEAFLNK
eukprot:6193481-Pleurochrysis_carterae.AAC.3